MRSYYGAPFLGVLVLLIAAACSDDHVAADGKDGGDNVTSNPGPPPLPPGPKPPGSACAADDECESTCTNGKCAVPSITDGRISPSLGETDIDCGGAQAPHCALGKGCAADTDCATSVCGGAKKCVDFKSCRATNGAAGMTTCGQGEVGDADANHESCCTSALLPGSTTRAVDRYKITAGRIREFILDVTKQGGGDPNIRQWALDYAAAHPDSQLAQIKTGFPGYLEGTLPSTASNGGNVPLALQLGAFPVDQINTLDGCYVAEGADGHATYWQEPEVLAPWGIGYGDKPDGTRKYSREQLDTKPMNCMMPIMLATFCAWDDAELMTSADLRAIWGQKHQTVGTTDIAVPWTTVVQFGQFNWQNGAGGGCAIAGWPGCVGTNPMPFFYQWPTGGNPDDDDSPAISAPGRFPFDVTEAVSATDNRGWYDVAGDMLEVSWPADPHGSPPGGQGFVCDMSGAGESGTDCVRTVPSPTGTGTVDRHGVQRYAGQLPVVGLSGYSFEGHANASGAYIDGPTDDQTKLGTVPMQFQYGKVDSRCARKIKP